MHLIELADFSAPARGCAVCLGTFDGVHLGHRALLRETVAAARAEDLLPCAYTFDLPPASVLTPIGEKAALMASCGIDTVVYSHFDAQVAAHSAEYFFQELLLKRLNAKHIVIGFHYHFGQFARGDAQLMRAFCEQAGVALTVVPPVRTGEGELVSSSAIRQCLAAGDREKAESMLNRALSAGEEALLGGRET